MVRISSHVLAWATFAGNICATLRVGEWPGSSGAIAGDALRILHTLTPPSTQHKFIFFELRESGGSAIRQSVAQGASNLKEDFFVPCQEKVKGNVIPPSTDHAVSCNNYNWDWTIGLHSNSIAAFAGHFYWHDLGQLSGAFLSVRDHLSGDFPSSFRYSEVEPAYSCLVVVRDPLSRFESCYNERLSEAFDHRSIADLRPFELDDALTNFTDGLHGCNNEIARFLSPNGWGDQKVNDGDLSEDLILETKRRLSSCVIGNVVADCKSTERVIQRSFPWIPFQCDQNNGNPSDIEKKEMPAWAYRAILKKNALDVELYNHAMEVFAAQLQL